MEIKEIYALRQSMESKIPLYSMSVSAGIPISVTDEIEAMIDINEYLVEHPAATYFARVNGDTMADAGIKDNDIVVFDTSLEPKDGKIVIAVAKDDFTLRIYRNIDGNIFLQTADNKFLPLKIGPYLEFKIIGVVTKVIHSL